MTESKKLFMVFDDTNNNPSIDEVDLSLIPSDLLAEIDDILSGKDVELAAA